MPSALPVALPRSAADEAGEAVAEAAVLLGQGEPGALDGVAHQLAGLGLEGAAAPGVVRRGLLAQERRRELVGGAALLDPPGAAQLARDAAAAGVGPVGVGHGRRQRLLVRDQRVGVLAAELVDRGALGAQVRGRGGEPGRELFGPAGVERVEVEETQAVRMSGDAVAGVVEDDRPLVQVGHADVVAAVSPGAGPEGHRPDVAPLLVDEQPRQRVPQALVLEVSPPPLEERQRAPVDRAEPQVVDADGEQMTLGELRAGRHRV